MALLPVYAAGFCEGGFFRARGGFLLWRALCSLWRGRTGHEKSPGTGGQGMFAALFSGRSFRVCSPAPVTIIAEGVASWL
ncbi:MAG: hypothetical protein Q4G30_00990 [Actinomycetaceae bacterium]|nr:hypothetical protein [Actinomycetaceae bacterium]